MPLNSFTSPITGTNLLADINPDMIESIQVLKDASSAAIYGYLSCQRSYHCNNKRDDKIKMRLFP
ncbi:MAG: hypothetical protein ACLU4J_10095 [Butyricimonas paravirosa]